jgi:hypothetical protein
MTGLVNSLQGRLRTWEVPQTNARLICTENFYIPPIILNKKPRPTAAAAAPGHTLVCVDGKQRLSSVKAFTKGIIPCNDHHGEKWWFAVTHDTPGGRNKRVLSEKDRKAFLRKEFVTFEYADLSQEQEEDLFARVQMGVQLTLAEKMRASTGPWQELARCYVDDYPIIYSLLKDRARAKDFQMTLSCFSQIIEVQHPTAPNGVPMLRTNHTHLPKLLENKSAVDDGIKSHLASVWNTFQDLIELDPNTFTNADKQLRGVQTFAPVEMVGVTILISVYSESRNNRLLIGDIKMLRKALRENFADLRLNIPVWKFIWDFIDKLEQIRGAVDGTTVNRAVEANAAPDPRATPAPMSPPVKRGRPPTKTKPMTVLPGSRNMDNASAAATPPTDSRPLKRPRVESVNTSGSSRQDFSSVGDLGSDIKFLGAVSKSAVTGRDPQRNHRIPVQRQTTSIDPASSAPKARPIQIPRTGPPVGATPSASSSTTQRSPRVDPSEARQNHISQLNSYRAPVAPMGFRSAVQISPTSTATATLEFAAPRSSFMPTTSESNSNLWSLPTRNMPPPLNTHAPVSPPPRKVLSPVRQTATTSPFFPSGPMRPLSSPSRESVYSVSPALTGSTPAPPRARVSQPNTRPALQMLQIDGAIDLTSDDEGDGPDLLALFGARASLEKSTSNKKSSSRTPYGQLGTNKASHHSKRPQKRFSMV